MKLTNSKLKQLIKEEVHKTLAEQYERRSIDTAKVGDYVEIDISDDGYDKSVEIVNPDDYTSTRSPYMSVKFLAKIEQVAGQEGEEELESDFIRGETHKQASKRVDPDFARGETHKQALARLAFKPGPS